jgi:SAM-dependent methyltransferase
MKRCLSCEAIFGGEDWTCPACGRRPPGREGLLLFAPELAEGGFGDADYAHEAIAAAEARHFWFDTRRRLVIGAVRRHCPQARSLLEVGTGTGFVLEGVRAAFPGLAVSGADALLASLARAARRLEGAALFQMDARRIPFRDEFDALLALDVIEHVEEDEAALREMLCALRPGGALVLTVPQHPWLWSTVDAWSGHRRRYTRRLLLGRLGAAGFRVASLTSFTSLLLPLLALARLRRPKLQEFDPLAELRIAPATNAVLRLVSAMERTLIRAGVPLPAGGSLLVVARRPA